jgi:hypothetical protein
MLVSARTIALMANSSTNAFRLACQSAYAVPLMVGSFGRNVRIITSMRATNDVSPWNHAVHEINSPIEMVFGIGLSDGLRMRSLDPCDEQKPQNEKISIFFRVSSHSPRTP